MTEKPYKVNSWTDFTPSVPLTVEVWYNGKDGFNIYTADKLLDTVYFHASASRMSAVAAACAIGWRACFGASFPNKKVAT
jgi:hypothetical protein